MKKAIVSILFILSTKVMIPQCDPEQLIHDLYSDNGHKRLIAVLGIEECRVYEALPHLESRIFEQENLYGQLIFLRALSILESNNLYEITRTFYENIDHAPPSNFTTPLDAKLEAVEILFRYDDFSTRDIVLQIVERDRPNLNFLTLVVLNTMMNKLPEYEEYCKGEFTNVLLRADIDLIKVTALHFLLAKYDTQMLDLVLDRFVNDPIMMIRQGCLQFLSKSNYPELHSLLIHQLPADNDWVMRNLIADSLLCKFGSPADLKTVIEYQPNEPDERARSLMGFAIRDFIPPRPKEPTTASTMLFTLKDYSTDCFNFGWISREEAYDFCDRELQSSIEDIEEGGAEKACEQLQRLAERVEDYYNDETFTIEGYEFLKYHLQYIKEKITLDYKQDCE